MDGFTRRKELKKQNILEAALALFIEYGTEKVSISKIAQKANVSQVTIYNYFESKHNLIQEVIIFYVDQISDHFDEIIYGNAPFPKKIHQIIFNKSEQANEIHEDFYQYLMKEHASGVSYLEKVYAEKSLKGFIHLFEEGRQKGYIDPSISNESILAFIHIMKEGMKKGEISNKILPFAEEITKLMFYGILGKQRTDQNE
ncbi:TetR/AcrR family transcriptional regulator [Cytobacillus gottheilii]|uniref:TetR/AcrR family transcriptional regulator n=1 Tax=Cytobacillus gottheilii TaxID=859144 RepID=UPI0009B99918|nr:TetR/AcrR family transcriptional regulator [Cytobacillus gottheilii]